MPPSSSSSDPVGLFDGIVARGGARAALSGPRWVRAILDVETALARAQADAGLIEAAAADAVARAAASLELDVAEISPAAQAGGNPVIPIVSRLRGALPPEAADVVHLGATSQDVLDTAMMLLTREALTAVRHDLRSVQASCTAMARQHRDTPMAGRTLLQHAAPTTFGLRAAQWAIAADEAADRLDQVCRHDLSAQLGGATGTLATMGEDGVKVLEGFARELDLAVPVLPWHTSRGRLLHVATTAGVAAAVAASIATDVILLCQTDIGELDEVAEEDAGGSSSLPHKRNPIAAVAALASAEQVPGLVATLLSVGGRHQLERAAGPWHAEWTTLQDLLVRVGSAVAWVAESLRRVRVNPARMADNIQRSGGLLQSETLMNALRPHLGVTRAHEHVRDLAHHAAASGIPFDEVARADAAVQRLLPEPVLTSVLRPGVEEQAAGRLVDRALSALGAPDPTRRSDRGRSPST